MRPRISTQAAPTIADVFHHVQRMPYGGVGLRDAAAVLAAGRGSCSGKQEAGFTLYMVTIIEIYSVKPECAAAWRRGGRSSGSAPRSSSRASSASSC